jgi:hypothetical protein
MTLQEFEAKMNNYELEDAYAEYIMENCHGRYCVCNGDTLINAMESGIFYEEFRDTMVNQIGFDHSVAA